MLSNAKNILIKEHLKTLNHPSLLDFPKSNTKTCSSGYPSTTFFLYNFVVLISECSNLLPSLYSVIYMPNKLTFCFSVIFSLLSILRFSSLLSFNLSIISSALNSSSKASPYSVIIFIRFLLVLSCAILG